MTYPVACLEEEAAMSRCCVFPILQQPHQASDHGSNLGSQSGSEALHPRSKSRPRSESLGEAMMLPPQEPSYSSQTIVAHNNKKKHIKI